MDTAQVGHTSSASEPREPRCVLLVDDHHGMYIAQVFAERYGHLLIDRKPGHRYPRSWRLYRAIRRAKAGPGGNQRDPYDSGYDDAWSTLAGFTGTDVRILTDLLYVRPDENHRVPWRITTGESGAFFAVHPDDWDLFHEGMD